MNEKNSFNSLISATWALLHDYYEQRSSINPFEYIVISDTAGARLLIDDSSDAEAAYVALEFPLELVASVNSESKLNHQEFSVVCEEVSHLFHYANAAVLDRPISIFELEARAEIDRFLFFMHWNDFCPQLQIMARHENCREICETLFEKRTFRSDNPQLYSDAESFALHHLKRAFSHCWTKRWIDTSRFDPIARRYLAQRLTAFNDALLSA